jgi:hypothetical protein
MKDEKRIGQESRSIWLGHLRLLTPGSAKTDRGPRSGGSRAMSTGFFCGQIVRIRVAHHGKEKLSSIEQVTSRRPPTNLDP